MTDPRRHADELAAAAGLERTEVQTEPFRLVAYSRLRDPEQAVNVYIEGDGVVWLARTRLSRDPTPRRAVGLQLAAADPAPNVVYLARPCQFIDPARGVCDVADWSQRRFSARAIQSMNEALDILVPQASRQSVHLIGYSGGAAVAVLIADRREGVGSLRTVAGNLAVEAVNDHHRVSPFPEALDPLDVAPRLAHLPQDHFVGSRDTVIPGHVARLFAHRTGPSDCVRVLEIDATHGTGWVENWRELLSQPPRCGNVRSTASPPRAALP